MKRSSAIVGVADHCGWAILVTVGNDNALLDGRRIELVEAGLPMLPHHHEGQMLPKREAVALVQRVQASAETCAAAALADVAKQVPAVNGIALRACPNLPDTIEERIASYHAQTRADGVMYRQALAKAAEARGWRVHWYETKSVFDDAARALGTSAIEPLLKRTKAESGAPWTKDHQVAMAAAIAAR
jgi:hypothetical protein